MGASLVQPVGTDQHDSYRGPQRLRARRQPRPVRGGALRCPARPRSGCPPGCRARTRRWPARSRIGSATCLRSAGTAGSSATAEAGSASEARRRTAWSTVGHEQEDDRTEPRFAYVMGKRTPCHFARTACPEFSQASSDSNTRVGARGYAHAPNNWDFRHADGSAGRSRR
jgi:hypothetical protein